MWIYYYCSHGPGHQGQDDGFVHFEYKYDREEIKDYLFDMLDFRDMILSFWSVKKPTQETINDSIKEVQSQIESLEIKIQSLKNGAFQPSWVNRQDETIIRNLKGKIDKDVIFKLHRAGLMYTQHDINQWSRGQRSPIKDERQEILRIIRRAKTYKSYNS